MGIALPERVRALTCIGCGAMGRQERCDVCTENRLPLVPASEYDELLEAALGARERVSHLLPVVEAFANADAHARARARAELHAAGPGPEPRDWSQPTTVIGWWCDRCGNVDLPQPCIGVCVWRPADWVNLAVYEREFEHAAESLRAAHSLTRFLARAAAVTPRAGQEERNRDALRAQAGAVLATL